MRYRPASTDDIEILLRHRVRMFADMGHADPAVLACIERVTRDYLPPALDEGRYYGLLAESVAGDVVAGGGVVIAPWPGSQHGNQPRRAWILNVYVEPEYRRHGVARVIMTRLIEWCRTQGFPSVSLHASDAGRALYEQLGFRPTNEMRLDLRNG
jgi:GNAT superfamily N-acetyltransferase